MKTKEELNALNEEVETVNRKLHELTEEELAQVSGGNGNPCVLTGPYWGNAMRTDGPYSDLCYQSGITAEYVATPGNNCKCRLWRNGTPVGWTDRAFLQ